MIEEIEDLPIECDPATRPPASPIPAGYSSGSYTICDKTAKPPTWIWYDPQIAE